MTAAARLVTIAISHYCEKVRWALDRAGVAYVEEPHAPLFHLFATVPRSRRRSGSTPLLVTGEGEHLQESTDILAWIDRSLASEVRLFPDDDVGSDVRALEEAFDRALGPATRRFAYHHILDDGPLFTKTVTHGVGATERALLGAFRAPIAALMRRGMRIDAAGASRSKERIESAFAEVEARLADGRPYLTGERFTAADLTFAALGAPVVLPPEYPLPLPDEVVLPAAFRDAVEGYRARPAGAFILRLYREERSRRVTVTVTKH